jgi:hypothetical protein
MTTHENDEKEGWPGKVNNRKDMRGNGKTLGIYRKACNVTTQSSVQSREGRAITMDDQMG